MKARLAAYAGYQLRDFLVGRMLLVVVATVAAAWGYGASRGLTPTIFDAAGGLEARDQLQRAFEFVVVSFAFVAAAASAQGLVARDRSRGYDRVLFARRLSPARYYLQGFLLAGVVCVVLAVAASQIYAAVVHPVSVAGVAAIVALAWLSLGGLAFLLSALTPYYVPVLVLAIAADLGLDHVVSGGFASGSGAALLSAVQYALPPAHIVAALRGPLVRGLLIDPRSVEWPIIFGAVSLALSVVLLRRRPFGS